jgi:hypothetical protein
MTVPNDDTAVLTAVPADSSEDDGFAAELAQAAPKRWWNKGTVALGAAVLLVGGFAGGLQAQKQWGPSTTAPGGGNRAAAGGFPGGQNRAGYGAAGVPGFGGGNAAPTGTAATDTTGTVKLVDGTTIYVQKADGTVVTVKTGGTTKVSTSKAGKLSDVKAGQSVTVQGATGSDGTVTATTVTAQQK